MLRMKWVIVILVVALIVGSTTMFILVHNKVRCTIRTNNYTSTVVVTYGGKKETRNTPIKYKFKDKMKFDATDSDAELYYHSKYDEYGTLLAEKYGYMTNTAYYVSLKIDYDFTKDNSKQENKLLISRNDTREQATVKLKNAGYTCK